MPTGKNVRIIFSMISKSLNIVMDIDRDQIGLGYFERTIYIIPMLPSQYYGSKIRLQGMKSVTHQVKKNRALLSGMEDNELVVWDEEESAGKEESLLAGEEERGG